MLRGLGAVILMVIVLAVVAGVSLSGNLPKLEFLNPTITARVGDQMDQQNWKQKQLDQLEIERQKALAKQQEAQAAQRLRDHQQWMDALHGLIIPVLCILAMMGMFCLILRVGMERTKQLRLMQSEAAEIEERRAARYSAAAPRASAAGAPPAVQRGGNGSDPGRRHRSPGPQHPPEPGGATASADGAPDPQPVADGGSSEGLAVDWPIPSFLSEYLRARGPANRVCTGEASAGDPGDWEDTA